MNKRLTSILIAAALLLSLVPVSGALSLNQDDQEPAYIDVNLGGYERRVQVFPWDEDLLFSTRDGEERIRF